MAAIPLLINTSSTHYYDGLMGTSLGVLLDDRTLQIRSFRGRVTLRLDAIECDDIGFKPFARHRYIYAGVTEAGETVRFSAWPAFLLNRRLSAA